MPPEPLVVSVTIAVLQTMQGRPAGAAMTTNRNHKETPHESS